MNFVSYEFIFLFMPIFFTGWFYIQKRIQRKEIVSELYLVIMSLLFYGWHNIMMLVVFLPMLLINWVGTYFMQKIILRNRRMYLCIFLVLLNIGTWLYFKYGGMLKIGLCDNQSSLIPIGISFYTLQQVMFLADSYRDHDLKYNMVEYLAYSTFYPCIISGPIVKHEEFISQLRKRLKEKIFLIDHMKVHQGIISFSIGMGKKVILARQLGIFADYGFTQPDSVSSLVMILSVISYTFQLYFDFSGYCDMAEGIALILGFSLPRNFESPYKAVTINEFWKKWHTSLTRFLTQYVYIPLGGSRHGVMRRSINIMIVYLISGFWHGTSITFILWGIIHAFLMIADKMIERLQIKNRCRVISQCITFTLVSLAWVPFRAENMADTMRIFRKLVNGSYMVEDAFWEGMGESFFPFIGKLFNMPSVLSLQRFSAVLFMFCMCIVVFKGKNVRELREQYSNSIIMAVICALVLWISVLQFTSVETFIYGGF